MKGNNTLIPLLEVLKTIFFNWATASQQLQETSLQSGWLEMILSKTLNRHHRSISGSEGSLTVSSRASLYRPLRLLWRKALELPNLDIRILAKRAFCKEIREYTRQPVACEIPDGKMMQYHSDMTHRFELQRFCSLSYFRQGLTLNETRCSNVHSDLPRYIHSHVLRYLRMIDGDDTKTHSLGWKSIRQVARSSAGKSYTNTIFPCLCCYIGNWICLV